MKVNEAASGRTNDHHGQGDTRRERGGFVKSSEQHDETREKRGKDVRVRS